MNKNIFLKICGYSGIPQLQKYIVLNKYYNSIIKDNTSIYIRYLSKDEKNYLLWYSCLKHLDYFIESLLYYRDLNFRIGLHYAIEGNNITAVRRFLEFIDPSTNENCYTISSVIHNKTKIFRILLEYDSADPNAFQNYCLRIACKNNNRKIVKMLLDDKRTVINESIMKICINNAMIHRNFLIVRDLEEYIHKKN